MSVCVTLCVCVCVCVCEWRGEFNRVVLVVQLGLIFHFILNPEQRRVFQLVYYETEFVWKPCLSIVYALIRGAITKTSNDQWLEGTDVLNAGRNWFSMLGGRLTPTSPTTINARRSDLFSSYQEVK
jgi:hypothetical protein